MTHLALYRGNGDWRDRLIRWWKGATYTHCELVKDYVPGAICECIGSSSRKGQRGVRIRQMVLAPEKWDVVPVPWAPADTWTRARESLGQSYDWLGLILAQFLNTGRHHPRKKICSEHSAGALGLPLPERYDIDHLAAVVGWVNDRHRRTEPET